MTHNSFTSWSNKTYANLASIFYNPLCSATAVTEQTVFVLILKCVKVKRICFLLRSADHAQTAQLVRYRKKIILIEIIVIALSESKKYLFYSRTCPNVKLIVKSEN